jgi:hypothetical protein
LWGKVSAVEAGQSREGIDQVGVSFSPAGCATLLLPMNRVCIQGFPKQLGFSDLLLVAKKKSE